MGGGSRAAQGARRFSVLPPNGKMSSAHRRRPCHRGRRRLLLPSAAASLTGEEINAMIRISWSVSESVSQLVRCRSARNAIDLIFTAQRFRSKE